MRSETDRELLAKLLDIYDAVLTDKQHRAFTEMRERLNRSPKNRLTEAQRRWAASILEHNEPSYQNAYSSGLVPSGKKVETPAVLRNLPLKPPPLPKKS